MDHLNPGEPMAIAFARVSIHSRAKGHSSVAASAYRAALRLRDERTGIVYDFTHKGEVVFKELLLPLHAKEQFLNREFLWNQIELIEKRKDAQVCKDIVLALPKELDLIQQIELTKRFARSYFVEHGIPADLAIHDHGDGNPHAHILVTTRRLKKEGFSKYKARDLNPAFYAGKVVDQDYWGDRWREMQTAFFKEKNIDLTVDLSHLIPERHEGKIRDLKNSHLKQANEFIREQRTQLTLNHVDDLIHHISTTHSVFTRRDIEKLIFKISSQSAVEQTPFIGLVEKVIQHKDLIYLGLNDEGREAYTTRNQYVAESNLLSAIEQLSSRRGHLFKQNTDQLADLYQLNEEQREALTYIVNGTDLSVLIGRPGVGKSYLLKPLKEYYEEQGCRVLGAALSGKVAKALQAETGIRSYTLSSLNYRLQQKSLSLNQNDIIVLDEAGMVDFDSLSTIIEAANQARAKLILVGDPDQLKPINKGEIFKFILSYTGHMELSQIRRQQDAGDQAASLMLAKGDIPSALAHYDSKGALHFSENLTDSMNQLVNDWQSNIIQSTDIKENVIFAFSRAAVTSVNLQARDALKHKGLIGLEDFVFDKATQDYDYQLKGDKVIINEIKLAPGERILLRKNDSSLGVRNGDVAFIESIQTNQLTARLDSGELITIPKSYKHIDYGYALTVHKGQGMNVNNARVLIDSQYWDRFLSFVAMTRHRIQLSLYADRHQHPDLNALNKTLSRSNTKDNVIDWPLDLAIRHGFESDSLLGRAINHLAGVGHKIKEKYNYVVNYEAYVRQKMVKENSDSRQQMRSIAKKIADYLDDQATYSVLRKKIARQAKELKVEVSSLKEFKSLYNQSVARDKKAHAIWSEHREQLSDVQFLKRHKETIQKSVERHERYLVIADLAAHKPKVPIPKSLLQRVGKIDLEQDKIHVIQLASQFNKKTSQLFKEIEDAQKLHKKWVFNQLKQENPILVDFDKLLNERRRTTGFKAEQLDNLLLGKAHELIKNKKLYIQLQNELPRFARSVALKIEKNGHEIDL